MNLVLAGRSEMVIDPDEPQAPAMIVRTVHPAAIWNWVRQQLLKDAAYVAKMTGIPELAGLQHLPLPRPSLRLSAIITNYRTHNPSTDKAKNEAVKPLQRLITHAAAKTLDDLTTPRLVAHRDDDPRPRHPQGVLRAD